MRNCIAQYLRRNSFGALRPKAVLFDMDGVLYDSMPTHAFAWQRAMAAFGLHMTAEDAYRTEGARGIDTIRAMVWQQQQRHMTEEEAQRMYDEKTRIFHQQPPTAVMEGVESLLKAISLCGLKMGVVTGSGQRPLINRLISDFSDYLTEDHIVTAYDVTRGKPNPDPYLAGLAKMGNLQPWEAIVVENAPLGVKAGVAARILTVAVNTGPLDRAMLEEAGADLVFDAMTTLANAWPRLWNDIKESTQE